MKPIAGEIELKEDELFLYITDSGRSSLRLILKSGVKNKRFLLPDFLCRIILEIMDELNIVYSFYKVNDDLSIDLKSIRGKEFDVLYLISYFGQRHNKIKRILNDDILVIEDNVFLPMFDKPAGISHWIGFNSYRKISYLADGSIIKSTMKLPDGLISKRETDFAKLKYEAKRIKYDYLNENRYSQKQYLSLFKKAEELLDKQREIHFISSRSLFNLFKFYMNINHEYSIRSKNYKVLDMHLRDMGIRLKTHHYSFYVLTLEERNKLREYLFSEKIFLPIHWPKIEGLDNRLYDKVISIPVDSRYREDDMISIAQLIIKFFC